MKKSVIISFLVLLVLISSFIFASFESGDSSYSIEKKYALNDSVKGWINISLENEPSNSLFEDSYKNSITLIKLLKLNNNSNHTCLPTNCENDYTAIDEQTTKTFTLNKNQEKILGFKFVGDSFEDISSFSVDVSSSASSSESRQLFIDILNDEEVEWQSYKPSNDFYYENYGCYESGNEQIFIYDQKYCEKINIPESPNVEIGAYVIEIDETGGESVFILSLNDDKNTISCEASTTSSKRISCVINSEISENKDFFVCIKTKDSADNFKYQINSETNTPCGYAGDKENERDFKIFAKPGKYASIGNFVLNNDELQDSGSSIGIKSYFKDYIERYNNDCSQGCIIPIRFISNQDNQEITVSDVGIFYTVSGTPKETNKIYDLTEIPAEINSEFQKLYLDNANFSVSGEFDEEITYSLNLNNDEIFSEEILFEKVPKIVSLKPSTVIAAYPTEFILKMEDLNSNVINYEWDFGDGNKKTTTENKVTHTYSILGAFELKITIKNLGNFSSSKIFQINVKTPKKAVNFVLEKKFNNLDNVTKNIENLPVFYQNSLNKILNLKDFESELISIQKRNSTAQIDEDYIKIMSDLIKLEVPESIFESKKAESIKFIFDKENINLNFLKEIGKGDYNDKKENLYVNAIMIWNFENMDSKITFKEFSAKYEHSAEDILNVFKLNINEKHGRDASYFIIKNIKDLEFKENYGQKKILDYTYIKLSEEMETIEFSTTDNFNFENLPAFISPEIRKLSVTGINISEFKKNLPGQSFLILIILFVIFIGFVGYIVLQEWYKRRYENYLFKNKNSLYNLISYIENAKKREIKNQEIRKKLKKSGWNSEQLTYIMKKYAGERTGMFEIPVNKILSLFKKNKKQNISKRNFSASQPRRNKIK
tara:strand:+ start:1306 stop:3963 length:2658 start_codon:yes stop_codon:yes gene_type:complete